MHRLVASSCVTGTKTDSILTQKKKNRFGIEAKAKTDKEIGHPQPWEWLLCQLDKSSKRHGRGDLIGFFFFYTGKLVKKNRSTDKRKKMARPLRRHRQPVTWRIACMLRPSWTVRTCSRPFAHRTCGLCNDTISCWKKYTTFQPDCGVVHRFWFL